MSRNVLFLAALCFGLAGGAGLWADDTGESDDFGVRLLPAQQTVCPVGATATVRVVLDFNLEGDVTIPEEAPWTVQGWSFGICNDPAAVKATAANWEDTDTGTVKDGEIPDFRTVNIYDEGVTMGVVIDFGMTGTMITLPPRNDFEALVITYQTLAENPAGTGLDVCDDLGDPVIVTVMVVSGNSIPPSAREGAVIQVEAECPCPPREFVLTAAGGGDLVADRTTGTAESVEGTISLLERKINPEEEDPEGCPVLRPVQGLSVSIADLDDLNVQIEPSDLLAAMNDGEGPDFFATGVGENCLYAGVVFSTSPPFETIVASDPGSEVLSLSITTNPGAWIDCDLSDPVTRTLTLQDGCGDPATDNVIVSGGLRMVPLLEGEIVVTIACGGVQLIRADANVDGQVNIADGVWILNELFLGGPATTCDDAADANDDGAKDSSDAVYALNYIFLAGPEPPAPGLACGEDPTDDALGCEEYPFCQ